MMSIRYPLLRSFSHLFPRFVFDLRYCHGLARSLNQGLLRCLMLFNLENLVLFQPLAAVWENFHEHELELAI